jgi:hypothetical protein
MWLRALFIASAVESRSGVVNAGGFGHLGDVLPHYDVPDLSGPTVAGLGVARAARRR